MGGSIGFWSKPSGHEELYKFLETYDISLETYQLGQMLTRSMFFLKNGNLGGWTTAGASRCEQKFADKALKLNWKEKIELASTLKDSRKGNDLIQLNEGRLRLSKPLLYYVYGNENISLMRSSTFIKALKVHSSFKKNISDIENIVEKSSIKMYTKSELIRERNLKFEKVKKIIEHKDKKKFIRSGSLIEHDPVSDKLIYYPENHPYFREWLLYNYAFWSPLFKYRTLSSHKDPLGVKTIKSRELIAFLAEKFKFEHPTKLISLGSKITRSDELSIITEKSIDKKFYSEKNISELLYKNSFFKNERLASVYDIGLIDIDLIAFVIESWKPFSEYKNATLSSRSIKAAEVLIKKNNLKKSA